MINNKILTLITKLNNREEGFELEIAALTQILTNNVKGAPSDLTTIILDNLESKGFINYFFNPYTKKVFIFNNKIKSIKIKSKSSRKFILDTPQPYKLSLGYFISKNTSKQKYEILLYVE